jgi:hypothetical protein
MKREGQAFMIYAKNFNGKSQKHTDELSLLLFFVVFVFQFLVYVLPVDLHLKTSKTSSHFQLPHFLPQAFVAETSDRFPCVRTPADTADDTRLPYPSASCA